MRHKYQVWVTDEKGWTTGAKTWAIDEEEAVAGVARRLGIEKVTKSKVKHLKEDCCENPYNCRFG